MLPAVRARFRQLAAWAAAALLVFMLGLSSTLTEGLYSRGLYPLTSVLQRSVSALFPFSLGDGLYAALTGYALWSALRCFSKSRRRRPGAGKLLLLNLCRSALVLYIAFKLLWGLNYSRPSISGQLGIPDQQYSTGELAELGSFLVDQVNALQQQLDRSGRKTSWTVKELERGAKTGYDQMEKANSFFRYRQPAVKAVAFSWLVSKIGIEGYYCPLSGEANVNMRLPAVSLPFVTCHEISHQLGVAREDEANLTGFLVSVNSSDPNFRYSGYYDILRTLLFELRLKSPGDFDRLYSRINARTLQDFSTEQRFWAQYNGEMAAYMNTALDRFLKINNQHKGTDSYQDIMIWVYNLHRQALYGIH